MISIAQKMARLADLFSGNQNGQGLPLSHRNYIVDGNFDSWTTSSVTMAVASSGYSPATVYFASTGGGSGQATLSRIDITSVSGLGGLTTPYQYAHRWQQTAAASTAPYLVQRVEGARTLNGRSATFSCWLWSNTASNVNVTSIMCQQGFGTGGSPSANVVSDKAVNWVVTPTPQKFSVRLDIPSVAGKSFGTNSNDLLTVGLYLPTGVTFDLITTQWQLEQSSLQTLSDLNGTGGLPTAFEYRGAQSELARVQRFYEQSFDGSAVNQAGCLRTIISSPYLLSDMTIRYKQTKRTAPTITLYSPQSGTAGTVAEYTTGTAYNIDRAATTTDIGTQAAHWYLSAGNGTVGNQAFAHWVADARF